MLDFFLVLGQIPGTPFYLTFSELFSVYSIALCYYIFRREYRIRTTFYTDMKLNYVMYSSRVRPGPVKRREVLPGHIDLTLLEYIDVEGYLRRLQAFERSTRLAYEKILQRGSYLRHLASGVF
jgi:hypothetical protein